VREKEGGRLRDPENPAGKEERNKKREEVGNEK